MRAVSLTYSGAVGVPIDDVFGLISDAARMPEWLPYCTSAVPSPTKKGKGDRHRLTFENQARKTHIVIEIIEYVPPTTLGWVEIDDLDHDVRLACLILEGEPVAVAL